MKKLWNNLKLNMKIAFVIDLMGMIFFMLSCLFIGENWYLWLFFCILGYILIILTLIFLFNNNIERICYYIERANTYKWTKKENTNYYINYKIYIEEIPKWLYKILLKLKII